MASFVVRPTARAPAPPAPAPSVRRDRPIARGRRAPRALARPRAPRRADPESARTRRVATQRDDAKNDAMATPRAMTMTRSNALVATRVTTRRGTATTRRARATRPKIESLGGFGPNIDAKEIQRRMAEKQRKIDENKRKAQGAKEASTAFGARREFQRTISSARPSRAGRTMPGGGVAAGTTSSKTKTTSGKGGKGGKEEAPKKKLFGLF